MLVDILLTCFVAGLFLWALKRIKFLDEDVKDLMKVVVIVALCLYLIGLFTGHWPGIYGGPYQWRK